MVRSILKSLRWQNLLFIALIEIVARYFIIKPVLHSKGLTLVMPELYFVMIVVATVLIAAGGYLINDYFDYEHDIEFKKRTAENMPPKKTLYNLYLILTAIALVLSFWAALACGIYKIGFVAVLVAGLLWFYSTTYKKIFLLGNLFVAIVAALVPLIVMVFELLMQFNLNKKFLIAIGENLSEIRVWIGTYAIFAFWFTLVREIVKDTQDYDADLAYNYNTLPLILGKKTTKIVVNALITIGIIAIALLSVRFLNYTSIVYVAVLVIAPLIFSIIKVFKANTDKDFYYVSQILKFVMLTAIMYPLFFNILKIR